MLMKKHILNNYNLVADMLYFKHPIVFDDNIDLRKKKKKKKDLKEESEFLKTNTSDGKRQKRKAHTGSVHLLITMITHNNL